MGPQCGNLIQEICDTSIIVGLVTDVVLLTLLVVALIALIAVFRSILRLFKAVETTVGTVQDAAQTISERVISPATENVSTGRRLGSTVGFLMGLFRKRRGNKDN